MRRHGTPQRQSDEQETAGRVNPPKAPVHSWLTLQRMVGNAAVTRAIEAERHGYGPGCGHLDTAVAPSPVQRRTAAPEETALPGQESVEQAVSSPGRPLEPRIRDRAEQHYPMSFSHVLVHSDPVAQRSAAQFSARAYTTGSHIVAGKSKLDDETILHEVDHVYQQAMGPVAGTDNGAGAKVSNERDPFEVSAARNGKRMAQGLTPDTTLPGGRGGGGGGVQRTAGRGAPSIQRADWEFVPGSSYTDPFTGHQARWQNTANTADVRTSTQLGIPAQGAPKPGDTYDDTTQQLHSSANVRFSKKGTIPDQQYPQRELQTRRALVDAKQRIASALAMLRAAGNHPGGPLLAGLQSGFPAFRAASPQQIAEFLPRVIEVVSRIQVGLNAQGAEIALVGGDANVEPGVQAWVSASTHDVWTRMTNPNQKKSEDLPTMDTGRSGPIHLMETGQTAWYIIHEATHRFSGTLDYQYSPYDDELREETFEAGMAAVVGPQEAARRDADMIGKRTVQDPGEYTGRHEAQPGMQPNWYALGLRALMNADSYAQFILTATGAPTPRS